MSVFNNEKCVHTAIESILNQTFKDFEFIIVDDGSSDDSLKIINNFAKKDARIRVIKNSTNIGLTKSLNKAIILSQGDFIARQDADDISLLHRLEKQLLFLKNNPNYSFCGTNGYRRLDKQELIRDYELNEIKENLILKNCFLHTSIVIRKKVLVEYGYYNEKYLYSQDFELWCRLIYKNQLRAENLRENLVIRNMSVGRFKQKKGAKFFFQRFNGIKIILIYLKYTKYKVKNLIAVIFYSIEMVVQYSLIQFFWKFLDKIKF